MEHVRRYHGLLLVILLLLPGRVALGQAPREKILRYECEDRRVQFVVYAYPEKLTTIYFASHVFHTVNSSVENLYVNTMAEKVTIQPRQRMAKGAYLGTLHVIARGCDAHLHVYTVDRARDASAAIDITEPALVAASKLEALRKQSQDEIADLEAQIADLKAQNAALTEQIAALTEQNAGLTAQNEALRAQQAAATTRSTERRILDESIKEPATVVIPDAPTGEGIEVVDVRWVVFGSTPILHYVLENHYTDAYRVGELELLNEHKNHGHAGEVKFDDEDEPGADGVLAVIPPRGRVNVAMVVREPEGVGRHVSLMIREPGGERPDMREKIPTWTFKEPAHENEGMMTLSVQGMYGAMWLGDGIDQEELAATSVKGLGVRLTYGLSRRLNLEIDALYASTGEARFADIVYGDDTQGELVRDARLGRVQGGLMARFGQRWYRPTLRVGLGVQGASHSAAFTPAGGGPVQEPDVPFEFDALWYFGAGMDIRLSEHFLAGASVNYRQTTQASSASRSFEAGAHLGYAWTP